MPKTATNQPTHPALAESQRLFQRVLASWASDLIMLRRSGLDQPGPRAGIWAAELGDRARRAA